MTEVQTDSESKIWVSEPLVRFENPKTVKMDRVRAVTESNRADHFVSGGTSMFVFPFTGEQLELIQEKLPKNQLSRLALFVDGHFLGVTFYTRDWVKSGVAVGDYMVKVYTEDCKRLKDAGIEVTGNSAFSSGGSAVELAPGEQDWGGRGSLEDLIQLGKVDNPYVVKVEPPYEVVLAGEPVCAVVSMSNQGMDRASFRVPVKQLGDPALNLRAVPNNIFLTARTPKPQLRGGDRPLLKEGESKTTDLNLSRSLGCEYTGSGTGPLSLEFRIETAVGIAVKRNYNCWLALPAPKIRVLPFDEKQFKPSTAVQPAGDYARIRLGSYPMDGNRESIAVFTKEGKTVRILRFQPPVDTTVWQAAWDTKEQKLHVIAKGRGTRYWVTASDQMGFEVHLDVDQSSMLETVEGRVQRKE